MSPTEIGKPTPQDGLNEEAAGLLAGIAKRNRELRAENNLTLQVPGYDDLMRVRYKLLPEAEMDRLLQRNERIKDSEGIAGEWRIEAQILVTLCDCIYVRPSTDDEYQTLEDADGPIRFERRFADAMQSAGIKLSGERATEIVLDFFSPREDPTAPGSPRQFPSAMATHVAAISAWNRGEKESISRRLLGES